MNNLLYLLVLPLFLNQALGQNNQLSKLILHQETYPLLKQVAQDSHIFQLQILYTRILHNDQGQPQFDTQAFGPTQQYFYPASLVKLPLAALALEKLRSLPNLDLNTPLLGLTQGKRVYVGCMAEVIEQMLVLSNNETFNLLFDWLGPDLINERLNQLGYDSAFVFHSFSNSPDTKFKKIFFSLHGEVFHQQQGLSSQKPNTGLPFPAQAGLYHFNGKRWLPGPKDYKYSNYISLAQMHRLIMSIVYPQAFPEHQRFKLDPADYAFLRYYMGCYPREADRRGCDSTEYHDSYMKFFFNAQDKRPIINGLRAYNKTGLAGGFISDCAYIVDETQGIEFFLSAALLTNPEGKPDGRSQDYENIGYPVLTQIFEQIFAQEKENQNQNKKKNTPLLPKLPQEKSSK